MGNKFTEEDYKKFTKLMSIVSTQAEFKATFPDFIDIYNLLDHFNKVLGPKIKANILEIVAVTQTGPKKEESKPSPKSKAKK